jgi:nonribosomal peptide synthetase DhbF
VNEIREELVDDPFSAADSPFHVLVNGERQYSLWPASIAVPDGWAVVIPATGRAECLAYIERGWVDMRPRSLLASDGEWQEPFRWDARERQSAWTSLPDLVQYQAERTPEALAVIYEGKSVTYDELNRLSNRMARLLIAERIGPETIVALLMPRSVELIVALLAIVKAGGAYLPLDPAYPSDRIQYMLADARPVCSLTTSEYAQRTVHLDRQIVIDSSRVEIALTCLPDSNVTDGDRVMPLLPTHPVYVIYTSGSTGFPKGVVLPSGALVNLLAWHSEEIAGGSGTTTAQFASLSFDAASHEIFLSLTTGRTIAVPRDEIRKDSEELVRWLERNQVNELFGPTRVVHDVAAAAQRLGIPLSALCEIVQSGEALTLSHPICEFCAAMENRRLHNFYGPTETHVVTGVTVREGWHSADAKPSIGRPIWNTRAYILNGWLEPVLAGVCGEIYVGGAQLARGYLRRPGLTAQLFVADPHGPSGSRMFRTGDLARWRSDGCIEFLGRSASQVRDPGSRVELAGMETVLGTLPEVSPRSAADGLWCTPII